MGGSRWERPISAANESKIASRPAMALATDEIRQRQPPTIAGCLYSCFHNMRVLNEITLGERKTLRKPKIAVDTSGKKNKSNSTRSLVTLGMD